MTKKGISFLNSENLSPPLQNSGSAPEGGIPKGSPKMPHFDPLVRICQYWADPSTADVRPTPAGSLYLCTYLSTIAIVTMH
jgi:hypothetical protein